ncbi:MAG: DUF4150 domain-containing protein [Pseudomonadota bacterium]|nr:DUF4150 domain-containing protein [Pseudomonadota bacterium]
MGITVNVNGRSLVHTKTGGFSKSTLPDVCKTPSAAGPVPVPYPSIVSFSKDLIKGTKTIKIEHKAMVAHRGAQFKRCIGDEAGTAKGIKSNTHRQEAKWITYSADVKLEGKAACRLGDKMFMNHANTICCGGEYQNVEPPTDPKCRKIWERIKDNIEAVRPPTPPGGRPIGKQGLAMRWQEIAENKGGWGRRPDGGLSNKMKNHMKEYEKIQKNLNDDIELWNKNNCDDKGGGGGLPNLAKEFAYQKPEYGPGTPTLPTPGIVAPSAAISGKDVALAAGGSALIVGGVLVVSRVIRLLPPLLPLQLSPL